MIYFLLLGLALCVCGEVMQWDVLGPFPAAPREAVSLLDAYGGVSELHHRYLHGYNDTFPSELADGGFVSWRKVNSSTDGTVSLDFNDRVDWSFISGPLGSAGMQMQGWATSKFFINETAHYLAICNTKEFVVDGLRVHGDTYGLGVGKAGIYLENGFHEISLWFSGVGGAQFSCGFKMIDEESSASVFFLDDSQDVMIPDIVDGRAVSEFVAVGIFNWNSKEWLLDIAAELLDSETGTVIGRLLNGKMTSIAPGQTTQIRFILTESKFDDDVNNVTLTMSASMGKSMKISGRKVLRLEHKEVGKAFVFTFLDVDGSVQYAAAKPPMYPCVCRDGCPVIFTTHGAGVDAKSGAWTEAYRSQSQSWILFPTNRGQYGYDWQGPGFRNALTTLEAFAKLREISPNYRADVSRIVFAGHSMGGHGCLIMSSHLTDFALAAAPASGWIKHQYYSPYYLRLGDELADSFLRSILEAAITEFDTDLYSPNLQGVPFLVRMGSKDDNVNPWHLRRYARLIDQINRQPGWTKISEIKGQGHWFDGIVDDDEMQQFFDTFVSNTSCSARPPLPNQFSVVTVNPATFEGRGGILPLQLDTPYKKGTIRVAINNDNNNHWTLRTSNIKRFTFRKIPNFPHPDSVTIDGSAVFDHIAVVDADDHFCKTHGKWSVCDDTTWKLNERSRTTYGPARQIFENELVIVYPKDDKELLQLAMYMTNDFYVQGRFSARVMSDDDAVDEEISSNVMLLGGPALNKFSRVVMDSWKSHVDNDALLHFGPSDEYIEIATARFQQQPSSSSVGVQALVPFWPNNNSNQQVSLALIIAGTDPKGMKLASSIFGGANGFKSGMEVPDYMVVGEDFSWQGSSGVLAAGFWDNRWKFNPANGYVDWSQHQE